MKVLIILDKDPYLYLNPFVYTLIDGIKSQFNDFEWKWGLDIFWTDECLKYDIIHIQWPNLFEMTFKKNKFALCDFENRLFYIKSNGIKIVSTCHNLTSHYENDNIGNELYTLTYLHSDCIIHLGEYSFNLFKQLYPKAKNVLIPHHVYDTIYTSIKNKEESLAKLKLSRNKEYILCFGAFRNKEERDLVINLYNKMKGENVMIIAPSFYIVSFNMNSWKRFHFKYLLVYIYQQLKFLYYKSKYRSIYFERNEIDDSRLPYFYGVADIVLIHRIHILNSGNVPLALLMKKVVVGPNTGNVGALLNKINNPTFNSQNMDSLYLAIKNALILSQDCDIKLNNYNYAMKEFNTKKISRELYNLYKELLG